MLSSISCARSSTSAASLYRASEALVGHATSTASAAGVPGPSLNSFVARTRRGAAAEGASAEQVARASRCQEVGVGEPPVSLEPLPCSLLGKELVHREISRCAGATPRGARDLSLHTHTGSGAIVAWSSLAAARD